MVQLKTGDRALLEWLPAGTIPSNFHIPDQMKVSGSFSGNMNNIKTNLDIESSFGNTKFNGFVNQLDNKEKAIYDFNIYSLDIDIGKFTGDTGIGRLIAKGKIKGQGYEIGKISGKHDLEIVSVNYNGYNYKNIGIKAELKNGQYSTTLNSTDSNFNFNSQLSGTLTEKIPTINGDISIHKINLQPLGFSSSTLLFKGNLDVNIENTNPRQLKGALTFIGMQFSDGKQIYPLDSIHLTATNENKKQKIELNSPFGWVRVFGDFDYTTVGPSINRLLFLHLLPKGQSTSDSIIKQEMTLMASLYWPQSLAGFAPTLDMKKPVTIEGRLQTDSNLLQLKAILPFFKIENIGIDSSEVEVKINNDSIEAYTSISRLEHPSIPLKKTILKGSGQYGKINWLLDLFDKMHQSKYKLNGLIIFHNKKDFDLRLAPIVLLSKIPFTTGDSNLVTFKDYALHTANIDLRSDSQQLVINTHTNSQNSIPQIEIHPHDFRLSTISGFLERDTTLAEGFLNGAIQLNNHGGNATIEGEIFIDSLKISGRTLGKLSATLSSPAAGQYAIRSKLFGNGNDLTIEGVYAERSDFKLSIDSMNLASVEPLTFGQIKRMKGKARGLLHVTGEMLKPEIRGILYFQKAEGNITLLNSFLNINDQQIAFDEKGIRFPQFIITDSLGGTITVNGYLLTTDYNDKKFDLDIAAANFMLLGAQTNYDQEFYGPAYVDSRAKVKGSFDLPEIDMNVRLRDKSNLTYIMPEEEPGIISREGVIKFVDRNNPSDSSLIKIRDTAVITPGRLKGIAFSGDLEITPASTLKFIVDKVNGDFIEANGNTNLNFSIEPSGKTTLTGRYEIEKGKYEMSLNQLLKRSFEIEKGSNITWNGDMLRGILDITAKYYANPPAIDLVEDQLSSLTINKNQLKQRIPVEVILTIKNEILKPEFSFQLDMPDKDRNIFNGIVYTRLKQINNIPSELNKQVMGLLVLQTFLSENPLASFNDQSGGQASLAAKQSVSKILSQQINNLAANLISGVDLKFDIQTQEDYNTGTRRESTNLAIGASKNLFHDRLSISVGSNIALMGSPQSANTLIGDVNVDYAITRDGRYKIRAYQRNQTDVILEGQIIETGLSFMVVVDFDKFIDLFQKSKTYSSPRKRK